VFGLGLVYKKGKFSAIEEAQLKEAIENYRIVRSSIIISFCNGADYYWCTAQRLES
jgi:hypothetical protein